MKMRLTALRACTATLALAVAMVASPAASSAQTCSKVKYRLWQPDKVTWYEYGETVEILEGEEGHLYLHVRGKGRNPYSASADIGYPSALGLGGDARRVRRHLKIKPQRDKDRRDGRLEFTAEEAGVAQLGYNLVDVKAPGQLKDIPARCRLDKVSIQVLKRRETTPAPGGGSRSAAREVTEMLFQSLLRRDRNRGNSKSFVDQIDREGRRGIEAVAETMLVSPEFRHEALRRLEDKGASRSRDLADLRADLLREMYRDLYGLLEPTSREVDEDLSDLDTCLSSERYSREACAQLGRNLVNHRLFYEENRELLDSLAGNDRRDRRRQRDRYDRR